MSVIDRLKRLQGDKPAGAEQINEKQKQLGELRRRIEQILDRRPSAPRTAPPDLLSGDPLPLESLDPGREAETPFGRVYVLHGELDIGQFWGRRRLREWCDADGRALAILAGDERLARLDPRRALFLDTETTGLAGGTGTLAFLIGVGWFAAERFVTRLIFARDFLEEQAALHTLSELAADREFLVTFNGKTFDVGLLNTRYILNRLENPLTELPHLDLLHPARRLVGHRLENCRLGTLENSVLGFHRQGDIPGSEVPERYFAWLRTRDARFVADVFEHNRLDVISLAVLAAHLAELVHQGSEAADCEPADVAAVARLLLENGDETSAEEVLTRLLEKRAEEAVGQAGRLLSLIDKRHEHYERATTLWRRMLEADPFDLFAGIETAKWLEHREKRFSEAITLVELLLNAPRTLSEDDRETLGYRLERLRRRARREATTED